MIADVGSGCGQEAVADWIGKVFCRDGCRARARARAEAEAEAEADDVVATWLGWRGWVGGTRRKSIPGGSWAPCSFVQSCTNGKTGVGHPAQPVRRMRRTHGAQRSRQPTHASPRHGVGAHGNSGRAAACVADGFLGLRAATHGVALPGGSHPWGGSTVAGCLGVEPTVGRLPSTPVDQRLLNRCTASTRTPTWSGFMSGDMPCPRLNTWPSREPPLPSA